MLNVSTCPLRHATLLKSILAVLLVAIAGAAAAQQTGLPQKPTVTLQVGARLIQAEVVSTLADRTRGLMFRQKLAPNAGMLFVFGREQGGDVCMWMKDTPIALSAAFIDGAGKVINIVDMRPLSDKIHCAASRAEYVLEVNQGIFAKAGVKPGARIGGLPLKR